MGIKIEQEQHEDVRILVLSGRLDTETAADVELAFEDLLDAGDRHFLIDLGKIGYVSSAGLRVLLALAKKLDGGKGSLRLCGLTAAVRQVFDVAGFSKLFSISTNRAAALGMPAPVKAPAAPKSNPLAEEAARLLGIDGKFAKPSAPVIALAGAVAALLGVKPASTGLVAEGASRLLKPAPAARKPAPAKATDDSVLGKIKRLFGAGK